MGFFSRLMAQHFGRLLEKLGLAWMSRQGVLLEGKSTISTPSSHAARLSTFHRAIRVSRGRLADINARVPATATELGDFRETAESRARALLLRVLSAQQRVDLQSCGYFMVTVPNGGTFCVLPRYVFNVLELRTGDCYCCMPDVQVPLSDLMLAQKLLLENDPEKFFAVANRNTHYMGESVLEGRNLAESLRRTEG